MGEKMTLEQVRERCIAWIADVACNGSVAGPAVIHIRQMFDHITQPAQAVDVGALARASAVHAAVGAIYFNDGSDYLPALWTVVRYLAPELMDELSSKPADVWHRTMAEVDRLTAALPNANGKEG